MLDHRGRPDPGQEPENPSETIKSDPPSSETADTGKRRIGDLIDRLHESAEKFAQDGSSRGDLKLVTRAIRELRYAFKVFSPYRRHRKVTVFGSARTPDTAASYQQAIQFGRAMAEQNWLVVTGAASGIMEAGHRGAGREKSMGLNIMLPFEQEANPVGRRNGRPSFGPDRVEQCV